MDDARGAEGAADERGPIKGRRASTPAAAEIPEPAAVGVAAAASSSLPKWTLLSSGFEITR